MIEQTKLAIRPQHPADHAIQQFDFCGILDVDAVPTLAPLYPLPADCSVLLNFAELERINSMGLAQLLKLFEHWQNRGARISVVNANRMIGVLFKMTGLSRLLDNQPPTAIPVATAPVAPPATAPTQSVATIGDAALQVSRQTSPDAAEQHLLLHGIIDAGAAAILQPWYDLPPHGRTVLDFAAVQRVNSMGLAQLLKLFEHWQQRGIAIRVVNVNRMIGVLFKMTGIARFLSDGTAHQPAASANPTVSMPEPAQPPAAANADHVGKLKLWVSAQSSRQMSGWYFFNTYLQRHLQRDVHLELLHGAVNETSPYREEQMDIVFTKPFEATRLLLQHGFRPISRPIGQCDEVTLLVRADEPRQTPIEFKGSKIVTAAQDNFVYLLGRFLLEQEQTEAADMQYLFSGHDIKALQMLLKGQADILFMLSDTYQGLSGMTRKMLRQIDQSDTAFAFHLFAVAPGAGNLPAALNNVLLDMNRDSQGRQILADLGIAGWAAPNPDEIDMLTRLYKRYVEPNTSD